jgi:hypothetical protein
MDGSARRAMRPVVATYGPRLGASILLVMAAVGLDLIAGMPGVGLTICALSGSLVGGTALLFRDGEYLARHERLESWEVVALAGLLSTSVLALVVIGVDALLSSGRVAAGLVVFAVATSTGAGALGVRAWLSGCPPRSSDGA